MQSAATVTLRTVVRDSTSPLDVAEICTTCLKSAHFTLVSGPADVPDSSMTTTVAPTSNSAVESVPKTDDEKLDQAEEGQVKDNTPSKPAEGTSVPMRCWIILFISCMGVLMASISSTALIIVFPDLIIQLDSDIGTMMYILLMLMLVVGGVVGIVGKLGDVFGQATLYKFGLFIFTVGSLIAGFADKKYHGNDLLGARCVIGFGAAFLFTNSSAILTNAFAPYNKVGLSQGIFQISSAAGMVLGPVVGGGFGKVDWRWIFFWNVPVGGLCTLLSLWAVQEQRQVEVFQWEAFRKKFDFLGAIFYPTGLVLIFIALLQLVAPSHNLSQTGPIATIITVGILCVLAFIVDQFYAVDPLVPPKIFLENRIFSATTLAGTCMAFVRNSITYNFIFYFQGPKGMSPLNAGIALIPFGAGVMAAGFVSGALSDKLPPGRLSCVGCIVTLVANIIFLFFDQNTSSAEFEGILFLAGVGIGIFQSPNNMSMMLCVEPQLRGVASAVSMLCLMVTSMLGIVLTFQFVLNSMSQADLFALFIYGGGSLSNATIRSFLDALRKDFYIVIACCCVAAVLAMCNTFVIPSRKPATAPSGSDDGAEDKTRQTGGVEMIETESKNNNNEEEEGVVVPALGGTYSAVAVGENEV